MKVIKVIAQENNTKSLTIAWKHKNDVKISTHTARIISMKLKKETIKNSA